MDMVRRDIPTKEIDKKNKLPRAVKISLIFNDPVKDSEVLKFQTIAVIPMWKNEINF